MLSERGDDRRCLRALTVPQMRPVAHVPLVLGVREALAHPEEAKGGMGRATPVPAAVCRATDLLQASQAPNTPVEPGWRWLQPPAAIAPVWLEQPERRAAWARLTGVGWLGSRLSQRQGRLSRHTPNPPLPGNPGLTAPPTAAVVWAWCAPVTLLHVVRGDQEIGQL